MSGEEGESLPTCLFDQINRLVRFQLPSFTSFGFRAIQSFRRSCFCIPTLYVVPFLGIVDSNFLGPPPPICPLVVFVCFHLFSFTCFGFRAIRSFRWPRFCCFTLYTAHYTIKCNLCSAHFTLYISNYKLHTEHHKLHTA